MSPEENKAEAQRAFDEFVNKGNLDVIPDYVAPDYVGHFSGMLLIQGREGFKQLLTMYNTAFSDRHVTIEDAIAEGDKVVVRTTFRGTHTGPLMNILPTGKQVTISALNIFRIVDGLAVEQWVNSDDMGLMQQLGVIPAPGQ